MRPLKTTVGITCVLLCCVAGTAFGQATPSKVPEVKPKEAPWVAPYPLRFQIGSLLVGRINPLGLEWQVRAGLAMTLYDHKHPAFRDNLIFFGLGYKINPAFIKIGPTFEVMPFSMLSLRFGAELMKWFGTFNYLQSFGSPVEEYSDTQLANNAKLGLNYTPAGFHAYFEPTFQVRFGPVVLRNRFSLEYFNMGVHNGDTVWYDITLDTLVPANGLVLSDDLDLIYLHRFQSKPTAQLALGVRYSWVDPIYAKSDFRPGESLGKLSNEHMRVGPLAAYTFFDRGNARFNRPTLLLIVNWYVEHRYRTGADVNQGVPYLVLGFAFNSDFVK